VILNVTDGELWDTETTSIDILPAYTKEISYGPLMGNKIVKMISTYDGSVYLGVNLGLGLDGVEHGYIAQFWDNNITWESQDLGEIVDIKEGHIILDLPNHIPYSLDVIIVATCSAIHDNNMNMTYDGHVYVFDEFYNGLRWKSPDIGKVTSIGNLDLDADGEPELVFGYLSNTSFDTATSVQTSHGGVIVFSGNTSFSVEWNSTDLGASYIHCTEDIGFPSGPGILASHIIKIDTKTNSRSGSYSLMKLGAGAYYKAHERKDIIPWSLTVVEDVNHDGLQEIFVGEGTQDGNGDYSGRVIALDASLSEMWSSTEIGFVQALIVSCIDYDNVPEVIVGTLKNETMGGDGPIYRGRIWSFDDLSGTVEWRSDNLGKIVALSSGEFEYWQTPLIVGTENYVNGAPMGQIIIFNLYKMVLEINDTGLLEQNAFIVGGFTSHYSDAILVGTVRGNQIWIELYKITQYY